MDALPKPFIKWAGGKGKLLPKIRELYPEELGDSVNEYVEPFVGGGAVLFDILSTYEMSFVYISDTNRALITAYSQVQTNCNALIACLKTLEREYLSSGNQAEYYLKKRTMFNSLKMDISSDRLILAALFIFLNKTCFNGLYRENKKGEFNVPMGRYKTPNICDEQNLRACSEVLQRTHIIHGSYKDSFKFINRNTFVYLDPPYRPISATSKFTAYTSSGFTDADQAELAKFVKSIYTNADAKFLLSNSDPKNTNPQDDFFDEMYANFPIHRVPVKRAINCDGAKRAAVTELLIQSA